MLEFKRDSDTTENILLRHEINSGEAAYTHLRGLNALAEERG
jgi:hypothetical protein